MLAEPFDPDSTQMAPEELSIPFKSKAQERWGNSPSGKAALGKAGVKEWDQASKGLKLPNKVGALTKKARGK